MDECRQTEVNHHARLPTCRDQLELSRNAPIIRHQQQLKGVHRLQHIEQGAVMRAVEYVVLAASVHI